MIYPKDFEAKIGFTEVRGLLRSRCLSPLGADRTAAIMFSADVETIRRWMAELREMRRISEGDEDFPLALFFDLRESMKRLRMVGTFLEERELFDLMRTLATVNAVVRFLSATDGDGDDDAEPLYPSLHAVVEGVIPMPRLVDDIGRILDSDGRMRDSASEDLQRIRQELRRTEGSISRILAGILRTAQSEGLVEKDAAPTLRDGRLVLPVSPGLKRKIGGIVHDESASGRTVYVEPAQVVEANNRIRELQADERAEMVRILKAVAADIRPHTEEILYALECLATLDVIQAKQSLARAMQAIEPEVRAEPLIDWRRARHPLLEARLRRTVGETAPLVPLDISLTPEKRILIISGPNAGGKSVCLKTVGLLQYMLQCGLAIPADERSEVGVFGDILIDIGDEQSLERDLSTYSSHLLNMKQMMRAASDRTLFLIDEFGTGTEPAIGGAIAESVLGQLLGRGAWGVVTTHYQNLKHYADTHPGVANGAMLYDRQALSPLFRLAIGRPGSSFAIEIARKIGLPREVIDEASRLVGEDYIQSDKYLQDIVRDKQYWEAKRTAIHQKEKKLDARAETYEADIARMAEERNRILAKAREEAAQMLDESRRQIENTIRGIREAQAEREETRRLRQQLDEYRRQVEEVETTGHNDTIDREMERIEQRHKRKQERRERKRQERQENPQPTSASPEKAAKAPLAVGSAVRLLGTGSLGRIESIDGKTATVISGGMQVRLALARLEAVDTRRMEAEAAAEKTRQESLREGLQAARVSTITRQTMDEHRSQFRQDLDVRGMRGDEALMAVRHFVDDAILVGVARVRILHGKGNGILRTLIRQYLAGEPGVSHFADEHVQFGGAGITVVEL